ncbi:FtsX-like permease family protein [Cellulomonas sp. ICMP 17802]|uniref:FtsX-like permease family protein n=1 Tax=Cellulomonas sp. ICMP 17802 TaxID=3239199 RepID=UPI00351AD1A4
MGWSLRVLRHRAAAQRTLLATVVAVALVGATLLGTFALLLFTSAHAALDTALDRAPATATDIDAILSVNSSDPAPALAAGESFLDDLLGDVPAERTQWLTSPMYRLVGQGGRVPPLSYLAANPQLPSGASLLAGAWPTAVTDDQGRVEVAVPKVAADAYGWTVGSELAVQSLATYDDTRFVVTGIHELTGPSSSWTRDLLQGTQHDPAYPVPGSFGFVTTDAWGPFVAVPGALTAPGGLARADLVAAPHLVDAPAGAVTDLRARLDDAQASLTAAVDATTLSGDFRSSLAATVDDAQGNLAVTRVSVVIVGLMLVVLAVTVLLLAARLLADRRAAEQTLMASRGASGRQLLRLAALEAAAVALVTGLVSPWLAGLVFGLVTSFGPLERAGMHTDPGRPVSLWVTCVVASFVLAGVLLGPLLRRRGSVVDTEQQLVRQDRRGGLARSGVDLALVALAGVAVWQLQTYRSPVVAGAQLDPILVAAPALLLLAGAVLALRALPLVAAVGERLAARGRSLVAPLAAWEVGRRPSRAAGAVLLLTLALAVGSFSQSFLSTWRTSQADQVDLAVGTDVRVARLDGSALAQANAVDGLSDAQAVSAVAFRGVRVGVPTGGDETNGGSVNLLALDAAQAGDLLRGRHTPDWGTIAAPLVPTTPDGAIPLPGSPSALVLDVDGSVAPAVAGTLLVTLVVEDAYGTRTPLELPLVPLVGTAADVTVPLPAAAAGLRLVAITAQGLPDSSDTSQLGPGRGPSSTVSMAVTVRHLRAVERPAGATADTVTAVDLGDGTWSGSAPADDRGRRALVATAVDDEGLHLTSRPSSVELLFGWARMAAMTFPDPGVVPVVATDTLLAALAAQVGDQVQLDLDGAPVLVSIEREVPYLPGMPRGAGVLVDRDLLTRAALLSAWTDPLLDEWWMQVPDDRAASLVDQVVADELGTPTSRVAESATAIEGPLRVGVQAALWIVTFAALALAVAGFAMSATVAVRTRRLELARLQALGASRPSLVRSVLVEHVILGTLGLAAGLALGALLAQVVAPLVTVSATGGRPVPQVVVHWPWPTQLVLLTLLVLLVGTAVALTTNLLLRRASGELLRLGDER